MAAGSSWSQVAYPPSQTLHIAQSDIRDYFFSLSMPVELRPLFCLPAVSHHLLQDLGVPSELQPSVTSEGLTWPMGKVVPMGWNWAMWIAQRVHQEISLQASGLDMSRVLVEGRPCPDLSTGEPILIPYADNLNVAGTSMERVQSVKDTVVARLRNLGFRVHEELDAQPLAQSLGFLVDGKTGVITPVPERLSKVCKVFSWMARRPRVSGKSVERLVGHAVHLCLLRRELLSIFRHLYDFIYANYNRRVKLWRGAAQEARWASVLLQLCSVDVKRGWSSDITASDASLSGIAVSRRPLSESEQIRHGRVVESWRYKSSTFVKPREHALDRPDPFSDPNTVKPIRPPEKIDPFMLNDEFPEIEAELMKSDQWHDVFSVRMAYPEHITLLEGRGIVAALRHKLRSSSECGLHHMHLNDNMSAVLLCSKGRSGSYGMLRVSRRIAALCLACDVVLHCRWIPSELNVSDRASRQWEHLRCQHAQSRASREQQKEEILSRCYPGTSGHRLPKASSSWEIIRTSHALQEIQKQGYAEHQGGEEDLPSGQARGQMGQGFWAKPSWS